MVFPKYKQCRKRKTRENTNGIAQTLNCNDLSKVQTVPQTTNERCGKIQTAEKYTPPIASTGVAAAAASTASLTAGGGTNTAAAAPLSVPLSAAATASSSSVEGPVVSSSPFHLCSFFRTDFD
jgi:hypothetical protein